MLALLQRVTQAAVHIDGHCHAAIGPGLLVLLCAEHGDGPAQRDAMLAKILKLRIFSDAAGKMNLNVQDIQGELLLVSQFTLAAETRRGNRPSFTRAAAPDIARALYDDFVQTASQRHPRVASGVFAANMAVSLVNDGPVTIPLHIPPTHLDDN